ncbi:MAG: HD domain-containing phosphohydrolase [Thiohalospira sp.]
MVETLAQPDEAPASQATLLERVERLSEIGIALSRERDTDRLLETILEGAKALTRADAGTLYLRQGDELVFSTVRNDTLGFRMGGTAGPAPDFPPLPLHVDGEPNRHNVAAWAAISGETVNIADAYAAEDFDFSGTRAVDERTGYRSTSFLTVPLTNHEEEVVGVLQLINALDEKAGVIPFGPEEQRLTESLASQAGVALTQKQLIDDQRRLFESFVEVIANAIDHKSKHTSGHCQRVPQLTMMIAEAANRAEQGPLADFAMDEDELYELKIAGWMHDCGKVTTPEPVIDKATKLDGMFDRIDAVDARFEVVRRDAEIAALRRRLAAAGLDDRPDAEGEAAVAAVDEDRAFVRRHNTGGEFMDPEDQQRIHDIAERHRLTLAGEERPVLDEDEVYNLTIAKGTLTPEERKTIQDHIVVTIEMLEALPYPRHLQRVPELAGGHHERMDGQGYPRGLTGDQMLPGARMMAIADIFEALTAPDRPYKRPNTLTESLTILGRMAGEGHLDPDLFDTFIREGVYLDYARQFLKPEQMDEVDVNAIPNYRG